ncbi:MAG: hypothetical protein ACLF0G_05975 [Candidatus Brocadiia bacterium]
MDKVLARWTRRGLTAVCALLALSSGIAGAADGDARSRVMALFPDAGAMGPPAWVKPGVRLTYYAATASVPHGRYVYRRSEDGRGQWQDAQGRRYIREEAIGASGHGYNQLNVVALSEKAVAIEARMYTFLNYDGPPKILSLNAIIGLPAVGGDFWVHPRLLARLGERDTPEITVLRMPFKRKGKTYQALAIRGIGKGKDVEFVYDLATGILLHSHFATDPAAGTRTVLSHCYLEAVRPVQVPWADAPAPAWTRQVGVLRYKGTYVGAGSGVMPVSIPASLELRVLRRGKGWLQYRQRAQFGVPPRASRAEFRRAAGNAQWGGPWLPPQGLGGLREGQVLDRDPLTKVTVSVTGLGAGPSGDRVVRIAEVGPVHRIEYTYHATSGRLLGYVEKDSAMGQTISFHLTGTQ